MSEIIPDGCECAGRLLRCHVSQFIRKNGTLCRHVELYPLKCKSCHRRENPENYESECFLDDTGFTDSFADEALPTDLVDGALYRINVKWTGGQFDSEWDAEVVLKREESTNAEEEWIWEY